MLGQETMGCLVTFYVLSLTLALFRAVVSFPFPHLVLGLFILGGPAYLLVNNQVDWSISELGLFLHLPKHV